MAEVTLDKVAKHFKHMPAVRDISLRIAHNEFVVLVGPSGCGKLTTPRMIAGLAEITEGTISIAERVVDNLPPREHNISMVFQNYTLCPHMFVRGKLSFGLRLAKVPQGHPRRNPILAE